ncbi:major paralogous domain-containing protein [Fibrobacter sp. UWEL]|nr:major paralogous domain-containing protein [Fibrobacter sp. UWEL]
MLIVAAMFVACGDDSGTSSSNVIPNEISYGTLKDSRDNQTYKTVTIGSQTWMAENLNYNYNEGSAKSYCYDDKTSNCDKYGRLYLWSAAMDSAAVFSTAGKGCGYGKTCASTGSATLVRGVCPEGWHLPNDDELNALFIAVGGASIAGTKLKSSSGWNSSGNGTDSFGFAVLPAGYRGHYGYFFDEGDDAHFWSSAEIDGVNAYRWTFIYYYELVNIFGNLKYDGFSVRCVKD